MERYKRHKPGEELYAHHVHHLEVHTPGQAGLHSHIHPHEFDGHDLHPHAQVKDLNEEVKILHQQNKQLLLRLEAMEARLHALEEATRDPRRGAGFATMASVRLPPPGGVGYRGFMVDEYGAAAAAAVASQAAPPQAHPGVHEARPSELKTLGQVKLEYMLEAIRKVLGIDNVEALPRDIFALVANLFAYQTKTEPISAAEPPSASYMEELQRIAAREGHLGTPHHVKYWMTQNLNGQQALMAEVRQMAEYYRRKLLDFSTTIRFLTQDALRKDGVHDFKFKELSSDTAQQLLQEIVTRFGIHVTVARNLVVAKCTSLSTSAKSTDRKRKQDEAVHKQGMELAAMQPDVVV